LLAVAKLNLGKTDESEAAYKAATEAQPTTLLAWQVRSMRQRAIFGSDANQLQQGLASFYEKTSQWPQAVDTQRHLADLAKQKWVKWVKCLLKS
jgi:lipopolysaccharide biosynthesis regulator YciM